jgi:hypothetical protein
MKPQKRAVAALAVAALLMLGGCTSAITGDGPVTFDAEQATVSQDTLNQQNYKQTGERSPSIERTVEVAGQERTVNITNQLVSYQKDTDTVTETSTFTVFSTPGATIAGQPVNPIASMSNDQLVDTVLSNANQNKIRDIQELDNYNTTVNGTETKVTKYKGTTTVEGQEVDVYMHLTKVQMGDDIVVAVGVYPEMAQSTSEGDMEALIRALQHD